VVYAGRSPESNDPVIHVYLNPLVRWIWLGGLVLVLGTILALLPNRQPQIVLQAAREEAKLKAFSDPAPARHHGDD